MKTKAKQSPALVTMSDAAEPWIAPEERNRMVAEAAYYRALERGFNGGDPMDDWLQAEQEIARRLPGVADV